MHFKPVDTNMFALEHQKRIFRLSAKLNPPTLNHHEIVENNKSDMETRRSEIIEPELIEPEIIEPNIESEIPKMEIIFNPIINPNNDIDDQVDNIYKALKRKKLQNKMSK